ncbi:thiamine pyrophosphate-dependent enzyme [Pseudorhodobacter sp. W20_MBD10_FR17]
MTRSGGRILVDALVQNGCSKIFGVPGESYLEALDAMEDHANTMSYISCRHEGGACFMATAHADLTGELGVCFVTRGPGATNASIGVHTAFQGSTPLLLLVGQIARTHRDKEAFQEMDYRRVFGQMAKWVCEIDDAARLPELVNRAIRVAKSGRPGPVVLVLPEDMLRDMSTVADLPPAQMTPVSPSLPEMAKIHAILSKAERPLILLGGSGWSEAGYNTMIAAAEKHDFPVCVGFRRHGLFPNDHSHYVGNLGFGGAPIPNDYASTADVIVAIGSRLGDGDTLKFRLIKSPLPDNTLIHVHPGAEELGRLYNAEMLVQADPNAFAEALLALPALTSAAWVKGRTALRAQYIEMMQLPPQAGPVDMGEVMRYLNTRLPADTVMTTGAGNAGDWPNIYYSYRSYRSGLAPVSGAMGYGVPAAVAAKIESPNRPAVYIGGDGDFLMNGQELATAAQYGVNPICIVVDNAMYGTIRMHQQRRHPGRYTGTVLKSPEFATLAVAYGGHGETVTSTEEFIPAFERAWASNKLAVIHVIVGPDNFGPNMDISDIEPI